MFSVLLIYSLTIWFQGPSKSLVQQGRRICSLDSGPRTIKTMFITISIVSKSYQSEPAERGLTANEGKGCAKISKWFVKLSSQLHAKQRNVNYGEVCLFATSRSIHLQPLIHQQRRQSTQKQTLSLQNLEMSLRKHGRKKTNHPTKTCSSKTRAVDFTVLRSQTRTSKVNKLQTQLGPHFWICKETLKT